MKLFSKTLIFLLLSTPAAFATSATFTNHQELKGTVHAYLTSKLSNLDTEFSINVLSIDQRLKLKKCPIALEIKASREPIKAGRNTVSVRCDADVSWRIFMSAHVQLFGHVLVSRHPLSKGHLIRKEDIELQRIELNGLRSNYLTHSKSAINNVLKRSINRGVIISVKILSKPTLINKGDTITILAKNNGFKISMKAIALSAGAKGDKIRARNVKTKKIVQGTVLNSQTILVSI